MGRFETRKRQVTDSFFDEPEEQSRVKAEIVVDYFDAWSRIMAPRSDRVGYFDFYAGPGRYGTGEKSTPLLILEHAIASDNLSTRLVAIFNDNNPDHAKSLEEEIRALDGIERLTHQPTVYSGEVDDELADQLERVNTIPALTFIDPWGYKGLSLKLIRGVVKDWGCEAIFFFNYNRINMGIDNNLVERHMTALFGEARLKELRVKLKSLAADEREECIRLALGHALEEMGASYLIPFSFLRESGRLSHYICFVTKHPLGYMIMKTIMANKGVVDSDGVPRFEYLPAVGGRQMRLDAERPLDSLPEDLLASFAGRTRAVGSIIDKHNIGTPFIPKNYKRVLRDMEKSGLITCDPDQESRRSGTMSDKVLVSFPARTPAD